MNIQPIEKRSQRTDGSLQVHSIFHTIQGEGPFCGTPAVFVRLAGCNLQCPACDTDYTSTRALMAPHSILALVQEQARSGLVVITGGEPFRQELRPFLWELVDAGYYVQIESNGTLQPAVFGYNLLPDDRKGVYLVCSPKTGKLHPDVYNVACALKYVVSHDAIREEDGLPLSALRHPSNPYPARPPEGWNRPVYVQPMDAHDQQLNRLNYKAAVASCLKHGHILQLQVHKIIGVA
jgi:7-carboxy-7-deazaguanine synthase